MVRKLAAFCQICFETLLETAFKCPRCTQSFCDYCIKTYLDEQLESRMIKIECPGCNYRLTPENVLHISRRRYEKFCETLENFGVSTDKFKNFCPKCQHIVKITRKQWKAAKKKMNGIEIECKLCKHKFCFFCSKSPHLNEPCDRSGELLLQSWARTINSKQINARKCPGCHIYIERSSGCPFMKCRQCKTRFCYFCGDGVLLHSELHFKWYNPFGCPMKFLPNNPIKRKIIRGFAFGAGVIVAPAILASLLVAGCSVLISFPITLPPLIVLEIVKYYERKDARTPREAVVSDGFSREETFIRSTSSNTDPLLE